MLLLVTMTLRDDSTILLQCRARYPISESTRSCPALFGVSEGTFLVPLRRSDLLGCFAHGDEKMAKRLATGYETSTLSRPQAVHFILPSSPQQSKLTKQLHHASHCSCRLYHVICCLPCNGEGIRIASGIAPAHTADCLPTKLFCIIDITNTLCQHQQHHRSQCLGVLLFGSQFGQSQEIDVRHGPKRRPAQPIVGPGIARRGLEQPDQSRKSEGMHRAHCVWPARAAIGGPLHHAGESSWSGGC